MSDRFIRSILTTTLLVGFFFVGAAHVTGQDFRNNFYVHQFWAALEATPGGSNAFSGPNTQSPASPAPGGSGAAASQPPGSSSGAPASPPQGGAPTAAGSSGPAGPQAQAGSNGTVGPQGQAGSNGTAGPHAGGAVSPHDAAIADILKEAQWVYSGMIYGFSFTYTPADPRRGIAGTFDLKPVAQIKWGDPHLKVLNTRVEGSRLIARVLYTLVPFQERWTEGWDSNVYPSATGRGSSRYFLSYEQKMASYRDAVKEAIREYLTQRVFNRPRKVTGQVVLRGNPYTIINAGRYITTVTVKLRIDKVEPYSIY